MCVCNSFPLWFLNKCLFIYLWLFWASLVAQLVKNLPAMRETWVGKIPWRREGLSTPAFWPGEFHGLYSPRVCKELDMTEWLSLSWLSWVFVAVRAFSSCGEWGLLLSCSARAAHCGGFCCWSAQVQDTQGSVVVAHGLSSCGSWA